MSFFVHGNELSIEYILKKLSVTAIIRCSIILICTEYVLCCHGYVRCINMLQGAGGTRQYPKGFLKEAFEIVRSKGGLCLADEVQTGLGRLGSQFWGFEHHDVMPDIGKDLMQTKTCLA